MVFSVSNSKYSKKYHYAFSDCGNFNIFSELHQVLWYKAKIKEVARYDSDSVNL